MALFRRRHRTAAGTCVCACGAPLDPVDMDFGFELPDVVWDIPASDRHGRIQGLDRVFVLDGARGFVRTTLPVELDHGSVTLGVWLEVPASAARDAADVWEEPSYGDLELCGEVANDVPPWGADLVGATAIARPPDLDSLPRVHRGDAVVESLLRRPWPRETVTAALGLGHAHR